MAPRSAFAKAREGQVQQLLGRLIQATLQDIATGENLDAALVWCMQHIKDHPAPDTNPTAVQADFQSLLEKLRVHSQLEAAEYLEEQHAAFMRCRLGEGEGRCAEAPEALLRALLLLARQPTYVSVRVVRSLRSVFESRKAQASQRRRREAEALHDRKALLEQELQEVADRSMLDWDEAWAQPDLVPESLILPPEEVGLQQHFPNRSPSSPSHPRSDSEETFSSSVTESSFEEEDHEEELESESTVPPSIWPLPWHELAEGLLPRPSWLHQVDAGLLSPATPIIVSEQAVQQMVFQLFLGVPGELNTVTHEGDFRWRLLRVEHLSLQSLHSMLRPLAELGSRLEQLRQFASVLERVAPPLSDRKLCHEIASLVQERQLSLQALAKLGDYTKRGHPRTPDQCEVGRLPSPHLFGRCWSSLGLALSDLLRNFESEVRKMDAELQEATTAPSTDKVCPSLCSLDRWAGPHKRAAAITHQVLSQVLHCICERCDVEAVEDWAAAAAEELVRHLARVLRGVSVVGGGEMWLGRLWLGAVQPVLNAMEQWATSGELHDPLGEFRCHSASSDRRLGRSAAPAPLFPQSAFAAGRHLQLLRHWAEDCPLAAATELGLREGAAQRATAVMAEAAGEPPRSFVPLETAFEVHVSAPMLRVAEAIQDPAVTSFMQDRDQGLLRHWAAIRLVAFLERTDAVDPFVQRVLYHLRYRSFEQMSCDTVAIELNAALAEGIEVDTCRSQAGLRSSSLPPWVVPLGLCAGHLTATVAPEEVRNAASRQKSRDPCDAMVRLRLCYQAPSPLNEVISEDAVEVYSSVLVLLLRVRYAEDLLLEVGRDLLSPLLGGFRNPQLRRCPGWWRSDSRGRLLSDFAHRCDLFRAEVLHFVRCLDRYLRDEAIAAGSKALAEDFRAIAGGPAPLETPRSCWGSAAGRSLDPLAGQNSTADVLEQVRCAHWAYLQQLKQDCFLAPELGAVRADLEHSTGVASELRDLLVGLPLRPHGGAAADVQGDAGAGDAQQALTHAAAELSRMEREFKKCTSYLLQVLTFSTGPGGGAQRSSGGFCLQANFNDFYGGGR